MSDYYGGAHTTVRLIDLATRMPRVLADTPVIVRGAMTGLLARPNSKGRSARCSRTGPLATVTESS